MAEKRRQPSWWKKKALQLAIAASTLLPARAASQSHNPLPLPQDPHTTTATTDAPHPHEAAPLPATATAQGDGQYHVFLADNDKTVTIQYPNGSSITRRYVDDAHGTRPWRNNNPGNVRNMNGNLTYGAIGIDKTFHLIFATPEEGWAAMEEVLQSDKYRRLSVDDAVRKWLSSDEESITKAQKNVRKIGGLSGTENVGELIDSGQIKRLRKAMAQNEGWYAKGHQTVTGTPPEGSIEGPPDFDGPDGDSHQDHSHDQDGSGIASAGALGAAVKALFSSVSSTLLVGAGVVGGMLYLANKEEPTKDHTDDDPTPAKSTTAPTTPRSTPVPASPYAPTPASPAAPLTRDVVSSTTPYSNTASRTAPQPISHVERVTAQREKTAATTAEKKDGVKWFSAKNLAIVAATAGVGIITYMAVRGGGRGHSSGIS